MTVNHHEIVALAVQIAERDANAERWRRIASYAITPSSKEDAERLASINDDDICQLCITMQRLCRGEAVPQLGTIADPAYALRAIRARLAGQWDDKALTAFGPMSDDPLADVREIEQLSRGVDPMPPADPIPAG